MLFFSVFHYRLRSETCAKVKNFGFTQIFPSRTLSWNPIFFLWGRNTKAFLMTSSGGVFPLDMCRHIFNALATFLSHISLVRTQFANVRLVCFSGKKHHHRATADCDPLIKGLLFGCSCRHHPTSTSALQQILGGILSWKQKRL